MIQVESLSQLTPERRDHILKRSLTDVSDALPVAVRILEDVRTRGDDALLDQYRQDIPGVGVADLVVTADEMDAAWQAVPKRVIQALELAARNIERFHRAQLEREMWSVEVAPGILAGRLTRPLENVGAYVPGGRAVYPSSVLMNVIPARVAGVARVVAATPPGPDLSIRPEVLAAMRIAGVDAVYKLGGAWAVGALAYGTATVPAVQKIVGPGNRWVTAAKLTVYGQVDVDLPAGPSEGLILADETADPHLLVMDFFSQLEHDPDAASVLVTTSRSLAEAVAAAIARDFPALSRKEIVEPALRHHSAVLVADDLNQAVDFVNCYAAEHLQIITRDPWSVLPRIRNAGSIFMGPHAPIAVGDYASGTNHVLPTGGAARMFSGLSVDDFLKKSTFQSLTREGLSGLKDAILTLAEVEGLPVHAETVRRRFK